MAAHARLYSVSLRKAFTRTEQLLDILGVVLRHEESSLAKREELTSKELQPYFREILATNDSLIGFGAIDVNGDYLFVSNNIDTATLPNLKHYPATRDSFERTLESQGAVVGRTYFFEPLDSWVIPLRKALRDETGDPIAVLATGINPLHGAFTDLAEPNSELRGVFINVDNMYRIFVTGEREPNFSATYSNPVNSALVARFRQQLAATVDRPFDDLASGLAAIAETPLIFRNTSAVGEDEVVGAAFYSPDHRFVTMVMTPLKNVYQHVAPAIAAYTLVFVASNMLFFILFLRLWNNAAQSRQELEIVANHDELTGLYNRHYLNHRLKERLVDTSFHILFLDLDNFKTINDHFGHHIGDRLIEQVARRLEAKIPPGTSLLRFGGDEFVLFVPADARDVRALANELLEAFSTPFKVDHHNLIVGGTIGIASSLDHQPVGRVLSEADMAMYHAKALKVPFAFYDDSIGKASSRRMAIEQHLRGAIENDEIHVAYQVQVDNSRAVHGVEALARWESPVLGVVPPDEFIDVAEDIGFMPRLGRHLIRLILRDIRSSPRLMASDIHCAINISVQQLLDENFVGYLIEELALCDMTRLRLVVEVTESLFADNFDAVVAILDTLREHGIRISMDDFGTGYSSLSLLKRLPIDELKIDKSFIAAVDESERERNLVSDIINIGHNLGMVTLAEGVETESHFRILRSVGCDLYQGYYFSRPLPLKHVEELIEELGTVS